MSGGIWECRVTACTVLAMWLRHTAYPKKIPYRHFVWFALRLVLPFRSEIIRSKPPNVRRARSNEKTGYSGIPSPGEERT